MISSLLGTLKRITVGNEGDPYDSEEEGVKETDEIEIPMVNTGISAQRSSASSMRQDSSENDSTKPTVEKTHGIGCITALDFSMGTGVIERAFKFDIEKFCSGSTDFQKGVKVVYDAERSEFDHQWNVTSMQLFESEKEKHNKEISCFKSVVAQVKKIGPEEIFVDIGKGNQHICIPNRPDLKTDYPLTPGDWVNIKLENVSPENDILEDFPAGFANCQIFSIKHQNVKTVVGRVSKRRHAYLIENTIYYTEDLCTRPFPEGTIVRCIAVQSTQYIGSNREDFVAWRAVDVKKSKFMHYSDPNSFSNAESELSMDDTEMRTMCDYRELLKNKFGVQIYPHQYLTFSPLLVGSSSVKTLKIKNSSGQEVRLEKIHLSQDQSGIQFKVESIHQEVDGALTFLADDEYQFNVTYSPTMIGKTKELCVFDFGRFAIGREISGTGFSEEENLLKVDLGEQRRDFKKQVGEQDIGKIIADRDRRRIRGNQTVRAPFFAQNRLPLNKVPDRLYHILKTQDETELRRLYPNALPNVQFSNYLEKFKVSLWFEEIENDLRRRQYDMRNVRLQKHGGSPVQYKFRCPDILDIQPPVNLQDTIDVFDEDDPKNAKFQGTIVKMGDSEVTCIFGDVFNNLYTGFPLTIQFNLGRTNYKRCHYAIQIAVGHLGKDFLFPEHEIIVKPARILTYEEGTSSEEVLAEISENEPIVNDQNVHGDNPFRKARPTAIFRPGTVSNGGDSTVVSPDTDVVVGKRVPSLRSRFISDTPSSPSTSTAKLRWFNTKLNDEQKNTVRRILRGQARPLPYIIFGPPGTGKTVTLVEAVMQVNKLDTNSRVLVCAPSNAAADVIAEYLANSGQFLPGDFVRLNGFLRAGQTMLESVAPFCTDGDNLEIVAMNRLVVCTCMTAGQFFSLNVEVGHFTHVFVDEAGYCTEPETMVPAILLAINKGGQLILAGDPNQLGPVLMSDVSQNCGLNTSFLERLMSRRLYLRDNVRFPEEKYNPFVLTKLVKNYRAHPTLLKLPSELFYNNDLVSHASDDVFELCQNPKLKEILVSEGVPIIFEGVQGSEHQGRDRPSWCNVPEAMKVAHYVNTLVRRCGLTHEDIGIITPYRKQVEKIRQALVLNLRDVDIPKVASVEEFQGGEKKVIIISTVRSPHGKMNDKFLEKLAFLYQPKRFNVVITRAKALMIIVGNPLVLERSENWVKLLKYAIELNAYRGCSLPITLDPKMLNYATTRKTSHNDKTGSTTTATNNTQTESKTKEKSVVEEFQDAEEEGF